MTPNPDLPATRAAAVRAPSLVLPGLAVDDLWLAPDGAVVAVLTGADSTGTGSVLFLDTATGAERGAIPVGPGEVAVVTTEWTAVAGQEDSAGEIVVRRTITGEFVAQLNPHGPGGVHALAIADRGDLGASIGEDGEVALWQPANGAVFATLRPTAEVDLECAALTFSPNGRVLAIRTGPDSLELWTTAPRRFLETLRETGLPVFSPDGRWVAAAGAAIRLYDLHGLLEPEALLGRGPLAFTPDGTLMVAVTPDGSTEIWRTDPPQPATHLRGRHPRLSPDGSAVAVVATDTELLLAEPATGRVTARLTGIRGEVQSLTVGPAGAVVVAACSDAAIRVWRGDTA
ncbi:WD40 repeat domain-containing protein [Sporichthya polymorpha]|uniref:WD40 repeat domain-containing protein n=1 Tax=Sporichthya polymorpha TaxID=35751 RepID=UPI000370413D|nr:PD40 domain-containing protein [Sporichthya polymorpha]